MADAGARKQQLPTTICYPELRRESAGPPPLNPHCQQRLCRPLHLHTRPLFLFLRVLNNVNNLPTIEYRAIRVPPFGRLYSNRTGETIVDGGWEGKGRFFLFNAVTKHIPMVKCSRYDRDPLARGK